MSNYDIRKMITDIARSYVGTREGDATHKAIVEDYNFILPHPRGYKLKLTDSWCAAFVSVVMLRAGVLDFPYECGAMEMKDALYERNCLIRGRLPHPSELVFFTYSHVGIVYGSNDVDGIILDTEGNSGKMVADRTHYFTDKDILCFASWKPYNKEDIVTQVMEGWWGDDWTERSRRLEIGGYNPEDIRKVVNERYKNG